MNTNYALAHLIYAEKFAKVTGNVRVQLNVSRSLSVLAALNYGDGTFATEELSEFTKAALQPTCVIPVTSYYSVKMRRFTDNLACNAPATHRMSQQRFYVCGTHDNLVNNRHHRTF